MARNKVEEEGKLPTWTLTFTDLPLGYYLLNSSDGAVCSLNNRRAQRDH